jgi:hypothetical protein
VRLGARSRARLGARLGASAKRAPERVHCVRSAGLLTCACQDRAGPQVMIDISRLPTGTLFLQGEPKGTRGREEPDLGRLNLRRFKHSRADQPPPRPARGTGSGVIHGHGWHHGGAEYAPHGHRDGQSRGHPHNEARAPPGRTGGRRDRAPAPLVQRRERRPDDIGDLCWTGGRV